MSLIPIIIDHIKREVEGVKTADNTDFYAALGNKEENMQNIFMITP